eukprot:TRINITY_DN700_c0_g1_i2.p1 TRINITY_DN700_c0_g1~~TRINITY_DN700_c0_g1_i2.p1  ORF type:complete len:272 (+),score=57.89 TRINITY_DN700_c0_g1_i2:505-1320(+)
MRFHCTWVDKFECSSIVGVGGSYYWWLAQSILFTGFYTAQWEEFHTGVMELGVVGVTEAQLFYCLIHLFTCFSGTGFWLYEVNVFGLFSFQLNKLVLTASGGTTLYLVISNVMNVVHHERQIRKEKGANDADREKRVFSYLLTLFPLIFVSTLSQIWLIYSPYNIIAEYPHIFLLGQTFMYSSLVGRLIVARVSHGRFDLWYYFYFPLVYGALNALADGPIPNVLMILIFAISNIGLYLHFSLGIIHAFCTYLNIKCLTIPPQTPAPSTTS